MTVVREPTLKPVNIEDLRPTQITVGMREVEAKRKRWREKGSKKELKFLEDHMIPVILGPKERHYIIDHIAPASHARCRFTASSTPYLTESKGLPKTVERSTLRVFGGIRQPVPRCN